MPRVKKGVLAMPLWRKRLFGVILVAMVVLSIVFWDTWVSCCCIMVLIQSVPVYAFNRYANMDLAEQFDNGINVQGWQ